MAQEKFITSLSRAKLAPLPFTAERGEQLSSAPMRQNRNIANPDIFSSKAFIQVSDDVKSNHHPAVTPKKAFGCLP